jgi:hypothetical protein
VGDLCLEVCFQKETKAGMGSRGSVAGSVFTEGDKDRQEWAVISPEAFYLGPGSILWHN